MASPTATSGVLGTTETVSTASSSPNNKLSASTASLQARGKKRPASPGNSSCPAVVSISNSYNNNTNKKKKPNFTAPAGQVQAPMPAVDSAAELKTTGPSDTSTGAVELNAAKPLPFKDPNFVHSGIGGAAAGKKNRTWKNLKQILAAERALPWQLNDPCYYNIDAPPSLKPAKKYSDISGLPANYTDPQTKLRFTSSEEFSYIRLLPTDVVSGYLALRKASCVVP